MSFLVGGKSFKARGMRVNFGRVSTDEVKVDPYSLFLIFSVASLQTGTEIEMHVKNRPRLIVTKVEQKQKRTEYGTKT
ncbi:hypothetical protein M758_7G019400 [Ceratodon purpureus]|nr:hypothetical protein M758_7G019400 [Ceratodon purpureus]